MINKYLGEQNLPPPIPFIFAPGAGIIRAPKIVSSPAAPVRTPVPAAPEPARPPARKPPADAGPIKFSSVFRP